MSASKRIPVPVAVLLAAAAALLVAADRNRVDPTGNFSFRVEIEGVGPGPFLARVEGLGFDHVVTEVEEPGEPDVTKQIGRTKWSDILVTRVYAPASELEAWAAQGIAAPQDPAVRRDVSLTLLARRDPLARWALSACFPRSWTLSSLDGKGDDVVMEEIVVLCNSAARVEP